MTSAPTIPRPVVRTETLSHDGAVNPTPPGFRVIATPTDVDPVHVPVVSKPNHRRRAIIALGAIVALVASIVWANSPDARSAAPRSKDGKLSVIGADGAAAGGLDGTEPLTLSLGWGPPIADRVDGLKENPYDGVARTRAKPRSKGWRDARIGTIRKVDDPKPNPY